MFLSAVKTMQCTPDIVATFIVAIRIKWPLFLVQYSKDIYSGQSDMVARKWWPKWATIIIRSALYYTLKPNSHQTTNTTDGHRRPPTDL